MSERRRVVITGIGPVTPVGTGVDEFWAGLTSGRNGVRAITAFDTTDLPVTVAGRGRRLRCRRFLDAKEARRTDPFTHYAISAASLAWTDAGTPEIVSERGGVIFATGIGGIQTLLAAAPGAAREGPGPRVAVHGADAHGERGGGAPRDALRADRAQHGHAVGLRLVEPRARRGHAPDPRRLPRPVRRRRLRGGHAPPDGRGVRADDGAHEEPRPRVRLAAVRRRPRRLRAVRGRRLADPRVRGARAGARRADLLRGRRVRRLRRRVPHHGARSEGLGGDARDALGAARRRRRTRRTSATSTRTAPRPS